MSYARLDKLNQRYTILEDSYKEAIEYLTAYVPGKAAAIERARNDRLAELRESEKEA